jgi:hypothetical protein
MTSTDPPSVAAIVACVASRNGDGRHAGGNRKRGRATTIVLVILLGLIAFGGGYLFATQSDGNEDSPRPTTSPTSPASPSAPSDAPTATSTVTPDAGASPSGGSAALAVGRSFVYAREATESPATLTFDLAEFYTGQEAIDVAGTRGITELPNDYLIVNDNTRLRTLPIAADATIRYIPVGTCCALKAGNLEAFIASVAGTQQTDFPPEAVTPWWITVEGGQIARIEQQYLP